MGALDTEVVVTTVAVAAVVSQMGVRRTRREVPVSYVRFSPNTLWDPVEEVMDQARSLFRDFHSFPDFGVRRARCRRIRPEVMVELGQLKGLIYSSDRGKYGRPRTFVHFLENPATLAANPEGTQLYILGGRYRVTRKGIVG